MKSTFKEKGYVILKGFFPKDRIQNVVKQSKRIFEIQFEKFGYTESFDENIKRLFNDHTEVFANCGKMIQQGLLELYSFTTDEKLVNAVKDLGVEFPVMCTRPVLFFNHPSLAKEEVYYKTPLHQDWPSMEASMDSVVVWIPLIDVNKENGSILIYPKTHMLGNVSNAVIGGFAAIENYDLSQYEEVQPELEKGDIVIFSTFLIHKSGDILNDQIRWSCHLRYTNMLDNDFIERGFPHPYIYKPIISNKTQYQSEYINKNT
jgi:phytanoyl-CoA hydroxylase